MGSCLILLDESVLYFGEPNASKTSPVFSDIGWRPFNEKFPPPMIVNGLFIKHFQCYWKLDDLPSRKWYYECNNLLMLQPLRLRH